MPFWPRPFAARFAFALASAAGAGPASAQTGTSEETAAHILFEEGRRLMARGEFAEACPKFERSLQLSAGIGTQFSLADCHERLGRTASAWLGFLNVAKASRAAGQPEREQVARVRASALAPKLRKLVVGVPAESRIDGLQIRRDGELLPPSVWDVAVAADPGEHTISATAPGKVGWEEKVTTGAAGSTSFIAVPKLEVAAFAASAPAASAGGEEPRAAAPRSASTEDGGGHVVLEKTGAAMASRIAVGGTFVGKLDQVPDGTPHVVGARDLFVAQYTQDEAVSPSKVALDWINTFGSPGADRMTGMEFLGESIATAGDFDSKLTFPPGSGQPLTAGADGSLYVATFDALGIAAPRLGGASASVEGLAASDGALTLVGKVTTTLQLAGSGAQAGPGIFFGRLP